MSDPNIVGKRTYTHMLEAWSRHSVASSSLRCRRTPFLVESAGVSLVG